VTHVTCRLTAKNRDQLRNLTLVNRVWATFTFLPFTYYLTATLCCEMEWLYFFRAGFPRCSGKAAVKCLLVCATVCCRSLRVGAWSDWNDDGVLSGPAKTPVGRLCRRRDPSHAAGLRGFRESGERRPSVRRVTGCEVDFVVARVWRVCTCCLRPTSLTTSCHFVCRFDQSRKLKSVIGLDRYWYCLQCFDAVGRAAGRASGQK